MFSIHICPMCMYIVQVSAIYVQYEYLFIIYTVQFVHIHVYKNTRKRTTFIYLCTFPVMNIYGHVPFMWMCM
jgi:hypothetical protein